MLHSDLLTEAIQLTADQQVLILNSAAAPFVRKAAQRLTRGRLLLAEDNLTTLPPLLAVADHSKIQHVPYHEYTLESDPAIMDLAIMDLLYQPAKTWITYGLEAAYFALKPGSLFYLAGAKDRGIVSTAKRLQERFGNVETLIISKGQRVIRARKADGAPIGPRPAGLALSEGFAGGTLDEGTRLLLEALVVRETDDVLDLGCGAGFLGLEAACRATQGKVTLVDASLVAVAQAQQLISESGLTNLQVLGSDGTREIGEQRFDLVVTNPPFHLGGIQTTAIAERFIREAAQVLRPRGRFYLVANRFLKYEPQLRACFRSVEEIAGNSRYKVLRALQPVQESTTRSEEPR